MGGEEEEDRGEKRGFGWVYRVGVAGGWEGPLSIEPCWPFV